MRVTDMPTVEIRLTTKVAESLGPILPKKAVTKRTKTIVTASVDHSTAVAVRDSLAAAASAEGAKAPEVKRLKKALEDIRPAVREVADRTSDVQSFALQQHPIGAIVPPMQKSEMADLRKSMRSHGYLAQYPVIVHEGMVLDGWHRYQIAQKLSLDPVFKDYSGDDPAGFVMSVNLHRRHLTDDQRAVVAGELSAVEKDMTTAQAAAVVNVRARKAGQARRVANRSARLAEAVRLGEVSLNDAARVKADDALMEVLNAKDFDGSVAEVVASYIAAQSSGRGPTVKLALDGDESWEHAEVVFDAAGEALGEAYWRPLPMPLEDVDTDPILSRIAEASDWSVEKKVVRAAIRETLEPREVDALYRDFEGTDPPADLSRSKIEIEVAKGLVEWFASADDAGETDEEDDDDEEE